MRYWVTVDQSEVVFFWTTLYCVPIESVDSSVATFMKNKKNSRWFRPRRAAGFDRARGNWIFMNIGTELFTLSMGHNLVTRQCSSLEGYRNWTLENSPDGFVQGCRLNGAASQAPAHPICTLGQNRQDSVRNLSCFMFQFEWGCTCTGGGGGGYWYLAKSPHWHLTFLFLI